MKSKDKRTLILNSALKVFARKGFYNARISDIAKDAKIADGTIYLYFENKNVLLVSVCEEHLDSLIKDTLKCMEPLFDPKEKLRLFAQQHLKTMKKNKNLSKLMRNEFSQICQIVPGYDNYKFKKYINLVAEIIRTGQREGVFRSNVKPDIVKRAFFGALDEVSQVWNESLETNYSVEEISSQIADYFLMSVCSSNR